MERIDDLQQYLSLVEHYNRTGCKANDFLQSRAERLIHQGMLFADCRENNAYLLEQKETCYRLYYYLNDLTATDNLDIMGDLVTEILYRGEKNFPESEVLFLEHLGFERNLVRDQYSAVYKDLVIRGDSNVVVRPAQYIDEVQWACSLFNETFDPYSGDFIPEREFERLLADDSIIVAVDNNGNKVGALHQTIERNVAWVSHVAVVSEARGMHVGQAMLNTFIEHNHVTDKSRYMLWVQQKNEPAVAMYRNAGFKYLNKSSLSLIRK